MLFFFLRSIITSIIERFSEHVTQVESLFSEKMAMHSALIKLREESLLSEAKLRFFSFPFYNS